MADGIFYDDGLVGNLARYVGETVTIFTTSGGLSGSGFTGVLLAVNCDVVKLLVQIGAPPACSLGSACTGPIGSSFGPCRRRGFGGGYGAGAYGYNPLGSVTEIPIDRIASFTHNAV